jgi:nucleoside phosphorylase
MASPTDSLMEDDSGRRNSLRVYFSHSYRYEDRRLNEFFWRRFWQAGFTFAVDPKSSVMSHPYLQGLIKRTPGFAAVITFRGGDAYQCSPFMLYEYSLALLARKPKLVFFDWRLGSNLFPNEDPDLVPFNPDDVEGDPATVERQIGEFKDRAEPYRALTSRRKGKFGIVANPGKNGFDEDLLREIEKRIPVQFGHERVSVETMDGIQLAVCFDKFDYLIMDVGPGSLPGWVHPFVHGRLIPSIKLVHTPDGLPVLPEFVQREMLRNVALQDEPVVFWRDREDLLNKLDEHFEKLRAMDQVGAGFRSEQEGIAYFRSAGRIREASIFISNPGDANPLVSELMRSLRLAGITAFQYTEANTIERGTDWHPQLRTRVEQASLFVALITKSYQDSEYCMEELDIALRRREEGLMTIIPYFLEAGATVRDRTLPQGTTIATQPATSQVLTIVREIDEFLRKKSVPAVSAPTLLDESAPVDVAILTIIPEEYEAVFNYLGRRQPVRPKDGVSTNYPSQFGEIWSKAYGKPYRVVLTYAGEAGPATATDATNDILNRWRPRYLVVVGVAGGLPLDGLKKGDVVVSRSIWNYEYGKVVDEFEPRTDNTYPSDAGLVNVAGIFASEYPTWWQGMRVASPSGEGHTPEIKVGMVGSGNKVVDSQVNAFVQAILKKVPKLMAVEMEGAGAALAVLRAGNRGVPVSFGMIRGISDMPRDFTGVPNTQTQERDSWKKYAANAAAHLCIQMLQSRWPEPPLAVSGKASVSHTQA